MAHRSGPYYPQKASTVVSAASFAKRTSPIKLGVLVRRLWRSKKALPVLKSAPGCRLSGRVSIGRHLDSQSAGMTTPLLLLGILGATGTLRILKYRD
jgi:hypothetical protein